MPIFTDAEAEAIAEKFKFTPLLQIAFAGCHGLACLCL